MASLLQVIGRIDSYLVERAQTHVVLVPSIQDIHHQPVFPQPPFPAGSLHSQHPDRYTVLPNPATFRCNEVTFGVVSSDVLKHLSGQEVQKGPQGDRLPGLAAHMLGQQRSAFLLTHHLTSCFTISFLNTGSPSPCLQLCMHAVVERRITMAVS